MTIASLKRRADGLLAKSMTTDITDGQNKSLEQKIVVLLKWKDYCELEDVEDSLSIVRNT